MIIERILGGSYRTEVAGQEVILPEGSRIALEWEASGGVIPPYEAPPELEPITILYPVDLWSRLTNAEADLVETAMATQPVRIQNIFRSASSYRSDHELWPLLETIAVGLFGAERAAQILAAS